VFRFIGYKVLAHPQLVNADLLCYFVSMSNYLDWAQATAERLLTKRKARRAWEKEQAKAKRTFKGELLGWLDAIAFAIVAVLLINQFIFQLYMIPSPSMEDTLLIKDRVWVAKTSYGIETYPGGPKIFENHSPMRDDVIVFYNPEYVSKGPLFDILSQAVYMATFTLVNIDVDEQGNLKERLYVKRAAALAGDTVRFRHGDAIIQGGGTDSFVPDTAFRAANALSQAPKRLIDGSLYSGIDAYGALLAYKNTGLSAYAPQYLLQAYEKVSDYKGLLDFYAVETARTAVTAELDPSDMQARSDASRYALGIYVPSGHVLPLGDNRDNSQDGRYFGPVPLSETIGRVILRFWPIGRLGAVT